jgi:hypothetical protein
MIEEVNSLEHGHSTCLIIALRTINTPPCNRIKTLLLSLGGTQICLIYSLLSDTLEHTHVAFHYALKDNSNLKAGTFWCRLRLVTRDSLDHFFKPLWDDDAIRPSRGYRTQAA